MARIASRIWPRASTRTLYSEYCSRSARRRHVPPPYERAVVGGHGMVGCELQALCVRETLERFEVADATARIARFQESVELGVAVTRVPAVVAERPVDAEHGIVTRGHGTAEHGTDAVKELLDVGPGHDVQRVGAEDRIGRDARPGLIAHVERDRSREVLGPFAPDPLDELRQILVQLARLPRELRQVSRKMHRVLSRAAADLEHTVAARELAAQDVEDRALVALAGFR